MIKDIYQKTSLFISIFILYTGCVFRVYAEYFPSDGDLYYDGEYYLDSYSLWDSPGPWSISEPGYEHDLWVHDPNFFIAQCTSYTDLPDGYDDCDTAGVADPDGPVFSFGTFDSTQISANASYFGAWFWTTGDHGTTDSSPFSLQGQENENLCLGVPSNWCMFSTRTTIPGLITWLYMNWGGVPTVVPFGNY